MPIPPRRALIAGVLLVIALSACGDSTGPTPTVIVTVSTISKRGPNFGTAENGVPILSCEVDLAADARGSGSATWQEAVFRWYSGPNRSTPLDSQTVSADEVRSGWPSPKIEAGQRQRTTWTVSAGAPFEVSIDFRYLADGSRQTSAASVRFACGPTLLGALPAPPSIGSVTVSPSSGELQPGETITVTYDATSASALWETAVVLSGGVDMVLHFPEQLATTTGRTVNVPIRGGARLGMPITVQVFAIDAWLQQTMRNAATSIKVVDRTPPSASRAVTYERIYRDLGHHLAGQYALGDSIHLFVAAQDNNGLSSLRYELGPPANISRTLLAPAAAPTTWNWDFFVPLPSSGSVSPTLTLRLRDAAGLETTITSLPDSIRIYPVVVRPTAQIATDNPEIGEIAYDEKRDLMYLALSGASRIAVLRPASMTFAPPIALPAEAAGMDLSLSGDSLVVALPSMRTLAIIDLTNPGATPILLPLPVLDTVGTAHPAVRPEPYGVRIAANGKAIVMLSHDTRNGDQALEVVLTTGQHRIRTDANSTWGYPLSWIHHFGRTRDRSRVVILGLGCPRLYVAASDSFTSCHSDVPIENSRGLTFDVVGNRFTVGHVVADMELHAVRRVEAIRGMLRPMAISPDGEFVYIATDSSITKMRVADGLIVERSPFPITAERVFAAPNGAWVLGIQNSYVRNFARLDLR